VPIPAGSSALVAPEDLADYLKRPAFAVGSNEERQAQQAVVIASATVIGRTGQRFLPGTSTETLMSLDGQWLYLTQRPVTTVTAVAIGGVAVTDYIVVEDRLFRRSGWRAAWDTPPVVTVTYSHGGEVPVDVVGAVLAVAAELYGNPSGLESETVGEYSYRLGAASRAALDEIELRYRGPVIA
jgi:hypothetical protein